MRIGRRLHVPFTLYALIVQQLVINCFCNSQIFSSLSTSTAMSASGSFLVKEALNISFVKNKDLEVQKGMTADFLISKMGRVEKTRGSIHIDRSYFLPFFNIIIHTQLPLPLAASFWILVCQILHGMLCQIPFHHFHPAFDVDPFLKNICPMFQSPSYIGQYLMTSSSRA